MSKNILIAYFSHGGENLIEDRIVDLKGTGVYSGGYEVVKLAVKGKI